MMKNALIGASAIVFLFALVAVLADSGDSSPQATSQPMPTNQAQIGDLLLTVNGGAFYTGRILPAEAGTHYFAIDITAVNMGADPYALNAFNFRLKDSDGFANMMATTEGPEPKIGHHVMVAGQEVRGFIVFKVGDGRTATELQYQSFTGTPGVIKLSNSTQ